MEVTHVRVLLAALSVIPSTVVCVTRADARLPVFEVVWLIVQPQVVIAIVVDIRETVKAQLSWAL